MIKIYDKIIISLLCIPKVGNKKALNFLKTVNEDIQNEDDLYNKIKLNSEKGIKFPEVSKDQIKDCFEKANLIINKSLDLGHKILTINCDDFPKRIKSIDNPPLILFAKGNVEALNSERCIAVIGKREPSEYGLNASFKIGSDLAKLSTTVVSGLASGCDADAHKGCVSEQGIGIGVLAHGLDMIFPSSSKFIADELIEKNGLLITEYFIGTKPTKYNFVDRDRIQSGISDIIFVIETAIKGGTMHTVEHSIKQNRNLVCLDFPEEAYLNGFAEGNKKLIKEKKACSFLLEDNLELFLESFDKNIVSSKKIDGTNTQGTLDF